MRKWERREGGGRRDRGEREIKGEVLRSKTGSGMSNRCVIGLMSFIS